MNGKNRLHTLAALLPVQNFDCIADFGRIDVVEYGPIGIGRHFIPVTELDADTLRNYLPLLLLTPIEVVRALLPEWTERGDGTFLLTHGASAVNPLPGISGTGAIMAATRSFLYSLNAGLAGTGVYAGTLAIAGLISGSEIAATLSDSPSDSDSPAANLPGSNHGRCCTLALGTLAVGARAALADLLESAA